MAFEITDYVKMTINKFGFDEDEILETIENYEDIVRKDNIVLYKKNFNFWEYCYLIYGCITNEIIRVKSIRKMYGDLPSGNIDLFSISPEEAWNRLHNDFCRTFPNGLDEPLTIYLNNVLKENEYLNWLEKNECKCKMNNQR